VSKLNDKQARFVEEYLLDLNAKQAAIRAGYSRRTAEAQGSRLLSHVKVAAAIAAAQSARSERTDITADMVLQHWWAIGTANANDLIELRRVCCRHCYGIDFEYQWVDATEFDTAIKVAAMVENADPRTFPTDDGGYGFNKTLIPHRDCPSCFGEGHETVFAHDTRQLRGAARLLYAGVEITRDGMKIKMRDQDKAMENVAKHLGMFKEKIEVEPGENLAALIASRRARAMARTRSEEEKHDE
jgi:phage terminase small subunit